MRPLVTNLSQLTDETPFSSPKRFPKDHFPLVPHNRKQRCRVPLWRAGLIEQARLVLMHSGFYFVEPALRMLCLHLAFDEGLQPVLEDVKGLPDTLVICDRHDYSLPNRAAWAGAVSRARRIISGQL